MPFAFTSLRSARTGLLVVAGLLAAGIAVRPLETPAWKQVRDRQPALRLDSIKDALGQGVTVGLLGGFRAIVADFFWIRTNFVWEKYDLPATQTSIKLVTAIDPRPTYFWLNGSRMIAYDMPNWRIDKAGGYDKVPDTVKRRFDQEQSEVAIRYLNEAFGFHPEDPLIRLEIANIYLNRLKDTERAAVHYAQAAEHRHVGPALRGDPDEGQRQRGEARHQQGLPEHDGGRALDRLDVSDQGLDQGEAGADGHRGEHALRRPLLPHGITLRR
jgi:hypothetical protein